MTLFLITAPSGAGKTTLAQEIEKQMFWKECISHTTRPMRDGEVEGKHYYYITQEEFDEKDASEEFAEKVVYGDYSYAVSKLEITEKLSNHEHVFVIVDFNGFSQMKRLYEDNCVSIFLHMSKEDCLANMLLRGDSVESATKRINTYEHEMRHAKYFDYVVKNVRGKQVATMNILKGIIEQYSAEKKVYRELIRPSGKENALYRA